METLQTLVAEGLGDDRSDALRHLIDGARRRLAARIDAAIYREYGEDPDLAGLAEWAVWQDRE